MIAPIRGRSLGCSGPAACQSRGRQPHRAGRVERSATRGADAGARRRCEVTPWRATMVAPAARGSAHLSFAVPWVAAADNHLSSILGGRLAKRPDGSPAGLRLLPNDRAPELDIRLRAGFIERRLRATEARTRPDRTIPFAGETLGHHSCSAWVASFELFDQDLPGGWALGPSRPCCHPPMAGRFSAPATG